MAGGGRGLGGVRPRGSGLDLAVAVERWPISGGFTISRGVKHEAAVVVATISDGVHSGRGECVPYARYGESVEGVVAAIEACAQSVANGLSRAGLLEALPPGAARNALDCALWDFEAKRARTRASDLAGLDALAPVLTALTVSLGTPEAMAAERARSKRLSPAQAQARGRRRCDAPRRRARGRAKRAADRRCERGLAA